MKITSVDKICIITIEAPEAGSSYSGLTITTKTDIEHGHFEGINKDIHFLNLEIFIGEFDDFISNPSLTPRLSGTYDTYLAFSTYNNSVVCEYQLGDAFASHKTTRAYQSGEFTIEQECLLELLRGFKALLAQQRL